MTKRRKSVLLTGVLAATLIGVAGPAHARTHLMLMPSVFGVATIWTGGIKSDCVNAAAPAALAGPDLPSKSQAILFGQESALERISRQQQGLAGPVATAAPVAALSAGSKTGNENCQGFSQSLTALQTMGAVLRNDGIASEDFLGSKRLQIGKTPLDGAWNRVRRGTVSRAYAAGLISAAPDAAPSAKLSAVNAWTNRNVRYADDQAIFGRKDYWADARSTLRRRAGDCEDIAIAKMQLLAAMGFDRSNMYLTIARDLVRNDDHAMLIVRVDGRNWLLDNATDTVLDANESNGYRPIMSFSQSRAWLHGYSSLAANVR